MNTITIFILQKTVISICGMAFKRISNVHWIFQLASTTIVVLLTCCVMALVINTVIPSIVGKNAKESASCFGSNK